MQQNEGIRNRYFMLTFAQKTKTTYSKGFMADVEHEDIPTETTLSAACCISTRDAVSKREMVFQNAFDVVDDLNLSVAIGDSNLYWMTTDMVSRYWTRGFWIYL